MDPRVSDEATGLPPLEELNDDETILVVAWASGSGVAQSPMAEETVPCRYLHLRGVAQGPDGPEWAQIHIAVPVEHAVDVAAALAAGGSFSDG
jgi:hypothetical protein